MPPVQSQLTSWFIPGIRKAHGADAVGFDSE
jgi:hypothetical protein